MNAHKAPVTALAFSQEGKYLAAYSAQDAKISFWQTQQTFLVKILIILLKFYFYGFFYFFRKKFILGHGSKSN